MSGSHIVVVLKQLLKARKKTALFYSFTNDAKLFELHDSSDILTSELSCSSWLIVVVSRGFTLISVIWWNNKSDSKLCESVTNYRLHLVYTVFYLYSIHVIELMHVSITEQPTLYINVLHTSHILVNYKYISL
jgi:hypothetical protein